MDSGSDDPPQDPVDTNAPFQTVEDKRRWIVAMRLKFCRTDHIGNADPTNPLVLEDGSINQDYFRSLAEPVESASRVWRAEERGLLIRGIAKHGIGHFREIAEDEELRPLSYWSPNDLRIKAMRLIGRQNLARYRDWKGEEGAITAEWNRNRRIGTALGAWKGSTLVSDEKGLVEQVIVRTDAGEDLEFVLADVMGMPAATKV
ncbi:hypothetical protein DFJ74DRAFT_696729 [Hyaloraphidium curvatum]|nr:hypothetical protein DFJ74DRAFT_696729 [Hyaloraphidium curvatum]